MADHQSPIAIAIEVVGGDDLDEFERLADDAFTSLAGERGGALLAASRTLGTRAELASALAAGSARALLARYAGASVGIALVRLDVLALGPIAVIEALFVEAGAREVGVGEALLDAATRWATESGALGLDVPALPGTRAAKSFLEEMGFRARLLRMYKELGN